MQTTQANREGKCCAFLHWDGHVPEFIVQMAHGTLGEAMLGQTTKFVSPHDENQSQMQKIKVRTLAQAMDCSTTMLSYAICHP